MSIIQTLIGAIVSSGSGGPPPNPNAFAGYSGNPTEGSSSDVTLYVENWNGSRIYWEVVGKGSPAADTNTDMTGTLSGFWDPGAVGSASQTVTTISFTAGSTEGTEFWGVNLGSSPGASDYYSSGDWPLNEPVFYNQWTIEWFQKSNPSQPSQFPRVFGIATYPSQSIGFSLEGQYYGWLANSGIATGIGITHNTWQHWALVSNGTVFSMYKDGSRVFSTPRANYGQILNTVNDFYVGIDSAPTNGYKGLLTNFRVVKGQAMYDPTSSSILVPAVPLVSNANTELLLKAVDALNVDADSSSRSRVAAGVGNNAFSTDSPFTAAGPYTALYPSSNVNVLYILKTSYPDIANVRAGWSATADDFSGTVTNITATDPLYYILTINVASGSFGGALVTFTQPPLGGSIEFYTGSYGYIRYDAGTQWALDVV